MRAARVVWRVGSHGLPAPLSCVVMPDAPALPRSPEQLLEELFRIFPEYRAELSGPIHDGLAFHSVLMAFTPFFGKASGTFSEDQLKAFGSLVSAGVESGGPLENAFGTCLLEHLGQIRAWRAFRPYLSKVAREKAKA
jgi:hypothetical protein